MNQKNSKLPAKNNFQEEKLFIAQLEDMVFSCRKYHTPRFSFFLDCNQIMLAEQTLRRMQCSESYCFFGGYKEAERCVLGIFPVYDEVQENIFPVISLQFSYRSADKLTHRDFLGALMSLQIRRNVLGDILVDTDVGQTVVFIYDTVSDMILAEVKKIGAVGVKVSRYEGVVPARNNTFEEIRGTVSSLRTDSITALAIRQSRERAASLIKSIGIEINHKPCFSCSVQMDVDTVFSVRGYGKFRLSGIMGVSKKGRVQVCIQKFV